MLPEVVSASTAEASRRASMSPERARSRTGPAASTTRMLPDVVDARTSPVTPRMVRSPELSVNSTAPTSVRSTLPEAVPPFTVTPGGAVTSQEMLHRWPQSVGSTSSSPLISYRLVGSSPW